MIKLDIVNAVVGKTNISRTKAEQAVETVFESLKGALGRGSAHRIAQVWRLQREAAQNRHWAESSHGRRGQHSSRQGGALQARQRTAGPGRYHGRCGQVNFVTPPETEQRAPALLGACLAGSLAAGQVLRGRPSASPDTFACAFGGFVCIDAVHVSLMAGTHFAAAYAHNQAASLDAFVQLRCVSQPGRAVGRTAFRGHANGDSAGSRIGALLRLPVPPHSLELPLFIPAPTLLGRLAHSS